MSSCSSSECSFEAFEPRQSLWKLVQEFLPFEEQREVREVLGEDIIDETIDLHKEVLVLFEIWQDYRDENERKRKELSLNSHYQHQRLPEPPDMRENLKKEIQLFVSALKQQSVENGSNELLSLSKREKGIVDYAFKKTASKESGCLTTRPTTAASRPSSSRSASRSSSSLSDVMESFQEKLSVQDVDQLADKLRNVLHEEKDLLLEDITFLQNSLFEESHFLDHLDANCEEEPSLQELKELGLKLEKEMTVKGSSSPAFVRNSSLSSGPRRPARARNVVRSSCSPNNISTTSNPSKLNDEKKPSPPRSQAESISPVSPPPGRLKKSLSAVTQTFSSDSSSPPTSAVIGKPGSKSMSPSPPTSALSKSAGSESLSPSPPTSAAFRRPGSASRFRKIVFDTRHGEC